MRLGTCHQYGHVRASEGAQKQSQQERMQTYLLPSPAKPRLSGPEIFSLALDQAHMLDSLFRIRTVLLG